MSGQEARSAATFPYTSESLRRIRELEAINAQIARHRDRLAEALQAIESMTGSAGAGQIPALPVARRAREALNG